MITLPRDRLLNLIKEHVVKGQQDQQLIVNKYQRSLDHLDDGLDVDRGQAGAFSKANWSDYSTHT